MREMLREGGEVVRQKGELMPPMVHVHVCIEKLSEELTTRPYN